MNDPTRLFIQLCWAAWLVFWGAMAFTTKRTVERVLQEFRGRMAAEYGGGDGEPAAADRD